MNPTGLVAALTVAALISACGGQERGAPAPATTSADAALTPGVNSTDRAFAQAMLAQRVQVDELIDLARTNSDNPGLLALVDMLASSEKQQSETINALLVQWTDGQEGGQGPPPAGPTLFDRGTVERLGSLRGPEFDTLWLQAMVNHHQAVLMMATSEIKEGEDVNAKTVAQAIVASREAEIDHMEQLLGGGPR
jgi:uncharacterized protein (DUF305 family)